MPSMKRNPALFCIALIGGIALRSVGQPSNADTAIFTTTGVETRVSQEYFKMGDIRLINNDWGSRQLKCNTPYRVFIEKDGSFGWEFTRGKCGDNNPAPDFPEVEFGIHPFGHIKDSIKTQDVSSTTLLPLQIKNITSASVKVDQMNITLQSAKSWNICFEMWFTVKDPRTLDTGVCPTAEVMTFWGWEDGRWPCDQTGNLTAGTNSYSLCHRSDTWSCGWRYVQFSVTNGPLRSYNGTLNVKAILDWLVSTMGMSRDLWVTRFEVGSEIGDNTSGKVTIKNLTFEVNGVSKSPEFRVPTAIREKSRLSTSRMSHNAVFPAGTSVEIVNMRGVRKTVRLGSSAVELGKQLPRGLYLMQPTDITSKNAIVVPVL